MALKRSPCDDRHRQKECDFACSLRFYSDEQHGPDEVEMFLYGKGPEMRGVEAALLVHAEWLVISIEQQAAWQVGVIQVDGAEDRDGADRSKDNIIRRKNTKTTSYVETAEVDATGAVIFLQE